MGSAAAAPEVEPRLNRCGAQDYSLLNMWDLSQTRDRTRVSCICRRALPPNLQEALAVEHSVFINHFRCFPEDFLRAPGPARPTPLLSLRGLRRAPGSACHPLL